MKRGWISLMALAFVFGCSNDDAIDPGTWDSYRNPVEQSDVQDPALFQEDGKFYLFSAAATAPDVEEGTVTSIIPIMESTDLTVWQRAASVFNGDTKPTFIGGTDPICPEIAKVAGKYLLYYSLSKGYDQSGIGVAVADLISGPYVDKGAVIKASSTLTGVISPSFVSDGSNNYLTFGNFNGIYLVKLSSDGLSTAGNPEKIASAAFDAPYIFKHGRYYYLFATVGTTEGEASCSCTQVVGRSENIQGPYVDKGGESMMDGSSELLIGNSAKFVGAGHGCVFDVADGSSWIMYNSYDLSNVKKGRTLMLDRISWVNDWPLVRGQIASFCSDKPVLNK